MNENYIIGESTMDNFPSWWESHLPCYLLMYCREGEARMQVQFENLIIGKGSVILISPDMFPAFTSRSANFCISFCIMNREFAETSLYGIPNAFYDCLFLAPVIFGGQEMAMWFNTLKHVDCNYRSFQCHMKIVENVLHNIYLVMFNLWQQQYGNKQIERELKRPEQLCMKFYNLVFDNFTEHRETQFYANRLCITPNYLAIILRKVCKESPKEAIDRQVVSEIKHLIKNTTLTAEQMAIRLHFPDTSYMCRYFKKRTGMSISGFRRKPAAKLLEKSKKQE